LFALWILLSFTSCLPDLVITRFENTGSASVNSEGSVEVPVSVTIKNQGTGAASTFKVSVDYIQPNASYVVAFKVLGQNSMWYPTTSAPLSPNNEITFAGKLIFNPTVHGTVSAKAKADSCSGDEFMPPYCRCREISEMNNESGLISLSLP